jgi:ATP-binding cassette, subfamily B, bacterial PglK
LTTVSACEWIYFFDHGMIKAQGTYDELIAKNEQFRKMAKGMAKNK